MSDTDIFIAGVGMTPFGPHPGSNVKALTREAVRAALTDAGCEIPQIEAAWFGNAAQGVIDGQHMIRGQIALRPMGFQGLPIVNVENACASGSTALHGAVTYLRSGGANIVLAVGAEKMTHEDRDRSFATFDGGWDVQERDASRVTLLAIGDLAGAPPQTATSRSVFMEIYAAFARQHMRLYGSTQEQFAAVSAKNHEHSVNNPLAQFRKSFTVEEILAAPSISWPITRPMCSPISDGAAAAVVCTRAGLRRLGAEGRAIQVRACILGSSINRPNDDMTNHIGRVTANKAYEKAGVAPTDVSVAEVHDATAVGEVIQVENLQLCPPGEGGLAAVRGETALGGRIPVNTSGGLESRGHPLGATGLGQVFELVQQLRGEAGLRQVENAKVAVAENGGGLWGIEESACVVTVLSR